jgi:hypothetical protein
MIEKKKTPSLKEVAAEVLAEGREWTRQQLQQRLQAQAEEAGAVSPPPATPCCRIISRPLLPSPIPCLLQ